MLLVKTQIVPLTKIQSYTEEMSKKGYLPISQCHIASLDGLGSILVNSVSLEKLGEIVLDKFNELNLSNEEEETESDESGESDELEALDGSARAPADGSNGASEPLAEPEILAG